MITFETEIKNVGGRFWWLATAHKTIHDTTAWLGFQDSRMLGLNLRRKREAQESLDSFLEEWRPRLEASPLDLSQTIQRLVELDNIGWPDQTYPLVVFQRDTHGYDQVGSVEVLDVVANPPEHHDSSGQWDCACCDQEDRPAHQAVVIRP